MKSAHRNLLADVYVSAKPYINMVYFQKIYISYLFIIRSPHVLSLEVVLMFLDPIQYLVIFPGETM